MKNKIKLFLWTILLFSLAGFVVATNCGTLTAQTTCDAASDCKWHTDPWGSWCEQKGCFNLFDTNSCGQGGNATSSSYVGKNCTWDAGSTTGWCQEANCWSLSGTNQSSCESNSYNISCTWRGTYSETSKWYPCSGPPEKQCWNKQTEATCENVTGCLWGTCESKSCNDYTTAATCTASASVGYSGNSCKWNTQYNYCYDSGCWDNTDKTSCEAALCKWSGGYCSTLSCYDYSYTNSSACINNTKGLNCNWNSPWCEEKGCWSYSTSSTCAAANSSSGRSCLWETYTGGWCEEVGCWRWDSWKGGYESACRGNGTAYGLGCTWNNDTHTADNTTDGWCYQDISSKSCANLTIERACVDSFYCFWNQTSGACQEPTGSLMTSFVAWYPGCYIFDYVGQSACQNVTGCAWNAGDNENPCRGNTTINLTTSDGGLRCNYINNSNMCNSMVMLPSCCEWQAGQCTENKLTTRCWDQMKEPPEGAAYCEDYNAYTDQALCNQIAGDPWYMPCKWDNKSTTDEGDDLCTFKSNQVFETGKESVIYLDNKKSCESAGGKWVTDMYCSSDDSSTSVALPMGKCEFKFDEERNCNKECFACDYKSDGTNWTTQQKAKDACISSLLGFCSFTPDTSARNGYGSCKVKNEFKKGIAKNCDEDCGSCTYMGDPTAAEAVKKPSNFCANSKKQGGCKWIPSIDAPTDESKGRCSPQAEKTCEDKCDLCLDDTNCVNKGAKKGNTSLTTRCSWDSGKNICLPTTGSNQMEVCWDGSDNDNNGKMDCADSKCFSDSFCGGGFMAGFGGQDCFGYDTSAACNASRCYWVQENWGSWCDMPGSQCWKNDGSQASCQTDGNCSWHSGFGGFCEENFSKSDSCMNKNQSQCTNALSDGCIWVQDQYYQDNFGGTGQMGWCDPDWNYIGSWYNCVQHDTAGRDTCEAAGTADGNTVKPCNWFNSSTNGGTYAGGWCDHMKFACGQFATSANCTSPLNQSGYNHSLYCTWEQDQWGSWCEGKMMSGTANADSCWNQPTQAACTAASCSWKSGFCDPVGFGSEAGFGGMAGGAGFGGSGSAATMGGSGMTCSKYDGNQTACQATNGCNWMEEQTTSCEVDFGTNCPQYSYNKTVCQSNPRCTYNDQAFFCDEKTFMCFWNTSYTNAANCQANSLCFWSAWNTCEPICFNGSSSTQVACGGAAHNATNGTLNHSACMWSSGICNPSMTVNFFKKMEMGAPVPLGTDARGDALPAEIDIVGFGIKDMGASFGLGIPVANIQNSSMCNGVKLSGNLTGKGQNTTVFYWYLDTDGNTGNNCAARSNSSLTGFEFYLSSSWTWGVSSGEAVEVNDAYQCSGSSWKKAPIPLATFKQKACQEIGGGIIALDKAELEKFPTLYNSSMDMRVYVTSANASGNATHPSDVASGAGYATFGSIDQNLDMFDMFKYKANASEKVSEGSNKGYVEYADVDCWTQTGCADYQCKGHPYCVQNSYGVEAAGFTDTRVPKIVGVVKETYPDAALLMIYTDKPSNMSLEYFGVDASCTSSNNPFPLVYDIGFNSSYLDDYRLWHLLEVNQERIGSTLPAGTTTYYKITFCDNSSKCGGSKCSSLVFEPSQADCGPFCKFVAKIDAPSNWNVSYDIDQDRTYEHVQGRICGTNAGVYVNYTTGRRANLKLTKSDNSTYIEFVNATLTKTGLSSNTRDINDETNSIASGTGSSSTGATFGYAGMLETTRDKIIHGLFPQVCRVKVPKGTSSCSKLYYCDENDLTKCVDRTAQASSLENGTDYCVWQIPCEFSVWGGGVSGTSSSTSTTTSSSSSSDGSGGAGAATAAVVEGEEEPAAPTPAEEAVEEAAEETAEAETPEEETEGASNLAGMAFFSKLFGGKGGSVLVLLGIVVFIVFALVIIIYLNRRKVVH